MPAKETLRAGDCAGFKAGNPNGHHLQNRSSADAVVLEIGSRDARMELSIPISICRSASLGEFAHS